MDFKEKKKISHFGTSFSRAAFFISENLPKSKSRPAYQPEVKVDLYPTI
jgi:hypothetical protein